MAKMGPDLDRLKEEILEYLRGSGSPIYFARGMPGEEGYVYWDTGQHPDWRQFVDVARESGARMFLFSSRDLHADELQNARDAIGDVEMIDQDREAATELLNSLRSNIGQVAWLRIAWQQDSRRFALEHVSPWYEKFLDLVDEIGDYLPEMSEEEEEDDESSGSGGYYSLN